VEAHSLPGFLALLSLPTAYRTITQRVKWSR
jgi:hypothetical protein